MPELPEVETTRRGIAPYMTGDVVTRLAIREARLRWPVPSELPERVAGARVEAVDRRGKYLLFRTTAGCLIGHLGMSGSYRVLLEASAPRPHDHFDFVMAGGAVIRYHDPRRFGCLLWGGDDPSAHALLRDLGPEPLGDDFDGDRLYTVSRGRRVAVKAFLMDASVVAGVGNIYASEALSIAGIHPLRAAGRVSRARFALLADAIRAVLARSIDLGGTTLRDFLDPDGEPGYFEQTLRVYGRAGCPCRQCGRPVRQVVVGQRATYYCGACQR